MPGGTSSQRDVTELPGAVAIVAVDDAGQVVLVRQYRHPVGRHLWEVPAGLLDSTTESAHEAGERELLEEAGLRAGRWETLADILTTPGMSDEAIRLLLARDLSVVPEDERPISVHEELDMQMKRLPLSEAVTQVFDGRIENGITVSALLAASIYLTDDDGSRRLRSADACWPARKGRAASRFPM